MLKKLTAFLTAAVMVTSVASIPVLTSYADTNSTTEKRVMEKLDRGTVAVKTNDGVYLSWRLLGTESLTNQAFDIYRDSEKIYTTGEHDATCYTDSKGTADNKYTVVPKGEAIDKTEAVDVWTTNTTHIKVVLWHIKTLRLKFLTEERRRQMKNIHIPQTI